jgi:hypothetical protein
MKRLFQAGLLGLGLTALSAVAPMAPAHADEILPLASFGSFGFQAGWKQYSGFGVVKYVCVGTSASGGRDCEIQLYSTGNFSHLSDRDCYKGAKVLVTDGAVIIPSDACIEPL